MSGATFCAVQAQPSRYVRRCTRCRQVRGLSSFARSNRTVTAICRTCRDREINRRQAIRVDERRLTSLRRASGELRRQLNMLGRKIARLEQVVEVRRLELAADRDESGRSAPILWAHPGAGDAR